MKAVNFGLACLACIALAALSTKQFKQRSTNPSESKAGDLLDTQKNAYSALLLDEAVPVNSIARIGLHCLNCSVCQVFFC